MGWTLLYVRWEKCRRNGCIQVVRWPLVLPGSITCRQKKVLINAQKGKTKALRQWRFTSKQEINSRLIKDYVREAVNLQKQGVEIKADRSKPIEIPQQLRQALKRNKDAHICFEQLSKGKQREYADYIQRRKTRRDQAEPTKEDSTNDRSWKRTKRQILKLLDSWKQVMGIVIHAQ